jgi:hypothetical protein
LVEHPYELGSFRFTAASFFLIDAFATSRFQRIDLQIEDLFVAGPPLR